MPKGETPQPPVEAAPEARTGYKEGARGTAIWDARVRGERDLAAQRSWQSEGSMVERRVREMFDMIALPSSQPYSTGGEGEKGEITLPAEEGKGEGRVRAFGLPETDALVAELARAAQDPSYVPQGQWAEMVAELQKVQTPQGEVDALALLARSDVTASTRWDFWKKEVEGLLRYAMEQDLAKLREVEPQRTKDREQKTKEGETPLELPPPQQDKLKMSMDKLQELKEGEKPRGYFSVHPFWGGYVREQVYEQYKGGDQWGRSVRNYEPAPNPQGPLQEERVYRGIVHGGVITELPMYYGFVADPATLRASGKAKILIDEEGLYVIDARAAQGAVQFTITIGQPKGWTVTQGRAKRPEGLAVKHPWLGDTSRPAVQGLIGDTMQKSREIKRFVQGTLEYSNDETLNEVYIADPEGYFAAIEKHKKADCDVSNGYGVNLRSAGAIKARMVSGHYVKMTDADGAAVMYSGSRHGWNETWDDVGQEWVRFDDTPPKDPTLDEERPDELAEDQSGPGDYGEQEAPKLTEEQFEELRRKIQEAQERAKVKTPEELKNEKFAKEVGSECTPEQAAAVRAKIKAARRLTDSQGRVIRNILGQEFQKIVDTNYKDRSEWRGPVPRSEGEELEDKVMAAKDKAAGISDAMGYTREVTERVLTQEYGGMKVYLVVDRSESMNWNDPTIGNPKKDEQQLAAFLVLDSVFAFSYKTEVASKQDQLVSPLAVESAVVAFQAGSAEEIKPRSATWTPKEQYAVWHGLESNIGGGTPAHLGLKKVRQMIEEEIAREKEVAARRGETPKKWVRVVPVFMDGGVDTDGLEEFLAEQKKLQDTGAEVSIWGMTESARAVEAYPNGHCVESARKMIAPVTKFIIDKAQKLKLKGGG